MPKFAGIDIRIGADTSRLGRDMKKADGIVGKFSRAATDAMVGVGIAAAGAAIKIGVDGVKAYIEDENAARKLAVTLDNVTKATDKQKQGVEDWITKTMFATGVADDQLRPAFARLIRSTNDITKAQKLLSLGLDISAGTGKSLDSVVAALGKSYDGNNASLGRLGLGIDAAKLKEGKFNDITKELRKNFQGFAEADADTMEGKLKRLNLRWQETKEQIGGVILEGLEPLMDWFETAEGQKTIQDLMDSMVNGFKTLAENLPAIIEGLKQVMDTFKNSNIDFGAFADPKLMAAATAFKYTPGPFQIKAIAALAAYSLGAASQAEPLTAKENYVLQGRWSSQFAGGTAAEAYQKDLVANAQFTGSWADFAMQRGSYEYAFQKAGFEGRQLTTAGFAGSNFNITVNGAVDPAGVAVTVQKSINKAARMGINSKIQGMGLGG